MNRLFLVLFGLLVTSLTAIADAFPSDSVTLQLPKKRLAKPVFNFDARYSFIDHETVRLGGVKFGVEWKEKIRAGVGIYLLSTTLSQEIAPLPGTTNPITANIRFGYLAGFGEYIFYRNQKWEFSTPNQLGVGNLYYDYKDANGRIHRTSRQRIILLEPSATGHYKFFYWVGVGGGVGYRQVLHPQNSLAHDLNAPIYYVKVKLFVGELYKGIFKNNAKKS